MAAERIDDVFDVKAWHQAGQALVQAGTHTLMPVEVQLSIGPGYGEVKPETRGLLPGEPSEELSTQGSKIVNTIDVGDYDPDNPAVIVDTNTLTTETAEPTSTGDTQELTQEEEDSVEFEGLFWVDGLALQWCITNGFDSLLREMYVMGRLDQRADNEGSNARRFVTSRQLGRVAGRTMEIGVLSEQADVIVQRAIAKHGSLLDAIKTKRNGRAAEA